MKLKGKYAILSIIVMICALFCINYHYKIAALNVISKPDTDIHELSIMSFNVAAHDSTVFTAHFQHRLLDIIKTESPDILCFQELSFDNLRKIKPQLDSIYGSCEYLQGETQMWRLFCYSHSPIRDLYRCKCIGDIQTDDMTEEEKAEVDLIQQRMGITTATFEVVPEH